MHVRIDNYDGQFVVRVKTVDSEAEKTNYRPDAIITSSENTRISWTHIMGDDYDWSNDSHVKHAIYKMHCSAIYTGGTLAYHEYWETVYYGMNNMVMKTEHWGKEDRVLYNANDNW